MANGWGDLGLMLTGGVQRSAENEYAPQLKRNYDAFAALEEAKIKRSQAMARDSLPAAMERLGYSADHATIMQANASPSMTQLGLLQNPNYLKAQQAALALSGLTGGKQDLGNMAVAQSIASGDPLKSNVIDDGYQLNPYDEGGAITPTGKVVADIGRINAVTATEGTKQGANNALTGSRNASANLTTDKQNNPDKYRAPKAPPKTKDKYEMYKTINGKKYGKDKKGDWYEVK